MFHVLLRVQPARGAVRATDILFFSLIRLFFFFLAFIVEELENPVGIPFWSLLNFLNLVPLLDLMS